MRYMTQQEITDAYGYFDAYPLSQGRTWRMVYRTNSNGDVELRSALDQLSNLPVVVSAFIEKVLQPGDVEDVTYVIDAIAARTQYLDEESCECLRILRAWVAKTSMMNVISQQNWRASACD